MTFNTLYAGQVNSPNTTLSSGIDDDDTTIPVTELGVFPAGPNLATIGTGSTAETILYTDKSAATGSGNLTGCTRAYDSDGTYGVAASWTSGEVIARNFCEHDWATIKNNAEDLNTRLATGSTDNAIIRADGTGGTTVQGSSAVVDDNGAIYTPAGYGIGVGTAEAPSYLLHIKGTAATDSPTYSDEFLDADNWTSADWTGSWAAGWAHTPGNTTVLSHDHNAVNATPYQIAYTVTGRTAGTFTITFGGETSAATSATGAWGPTTTGTGVLQITPTSDFDGTVVISIKSVTAVSTPAILLERSDGTDVMEMRGHTNNTNIFIGLNAGAYTTTGNYNTAIGYYALYTNSTGNYNTAIGRNALYNNSTGTNNTAIGLNALYTNSTGNANTAIGYYALYTNSTGNANTAIGLNALRTNSTGTNNTAIGNNAGYDDNQKADAENSMALGYGSFCDRSNQVVIGDENVVETQLRTGVYIGSTSTTAHTQPTARLHIAAGTAGAGTAPLKLTAGPVNTTPEAGAIEFDGTNLYFTDSTNTRRTLAVMP